MAQKARTQHSCPVCRETVYNDIRTYHDHLDICCNGLFLKYPSIKQDSFNALWYRLQGMVKDGLVIPSRQKGVSATIHTRPHSQQPPPIYHHHLPHQRQYTHQPSSAYSPYSYGNSQSPSERGADLEEIDREIDYLRERNKQKERERIINRKRRREEMEKEIENEMKNDEFNKSMPKIIKNDKRKKRRLLYHNTSDIRPPKRVNIDPEISIDLFQHKIRETRRLYHNVSYHDFAENNNKNENKINVDHHPSVIHAQKALDRYLLNCQVLRKCFNGELFEKMAKKSEKVYAKNFENIMLSTLNEINVWQNFETDNKDENDNNNKSDAEQLKKEDFVSCWDAIPQQTYQFHLDKLLQRENLCGFYANDNHETDDDSKKYGFWNSNDNVKNVDVNENNSLFESNENKNFLSL